MNRKQSAQNYEVNGNAEDPQTLEWAKDLKEARTYVFEEIDSLLQRQLLTIDGHERARIQEKYSRAIEIRRILERSNQSPHDILRALANIERCRDALVTQYTGVVPFIARQWLHPDETLTFDALSNGYLRLAEGTELFDYERDSKFLSFATYIVRRAIAMTLDRQNDYSTTNPSRYLQWSKRRVVSVGISTASEWSIDNAKRIGILSYDQIQTKLKRRRDPVPLIDLCTDPRMREPADIAESEIDIHAGFDASLLGIHTTNDFLEALLEELEPRERAIVILRAGLSDLLSMLSPSLQEEAKIRLFPNNSKKSWTDGLTLEDVGKCMKITKERVRQINRKAMKKIHEKFEALQMECSRLRR